MEQFIALETYVTQSMGIVFNYILYIRASGSATDYFYDKGVKYSYAMELPGTPGGFLLPASHIVPVADETMRGIASLFEFIATNEGPLDLNESD